MSGEEQPIVSPTPTVLLVLGDEQEAGDLADRLGHVGFEVVRGSSQKDALAHFSARVDAVLVATEVGNDDGAQIARELKDRVGDGSFLPVLMLGGDDSDARVRAFEAGCDDFLDAGVSFFELDARIRSLLLHRWNYAALAQANRRLFEVQEKKRELAALVVHDLRNPLSALQGNVELLYEDLAADTRFAGVLADSQDLCSKALSMCAAILDVEELEAGLLHAVPSEVPMRSFLERSSRHHRTPVDVRRLALVVEADDDLSGAFDLELVTRVVENLLDNAVRYAPIGGKVVLAASRANGILEIRVGNDGPPVPERDRERIFERFYRIEARRAGARSNRGLGLYFCRLVAEAHGGTIAVEERGELGACFTMRLPQEG